jgi:hypothetical protein
MTSVENMNSVNQSNVRAEDGFQGRASWNSFCEGILIPLGSLGAVFLVMLAVMLISN